MSARSSTVKRPPNPNLLLAALPAAEYTRLVGGMDVVPLKLMTIIQQPGERVRHVHFPGGGFMSVLTILGDGTMVEVTTIGREGVTGVPAALSDQPVSVMTMVQAEMDVCFRLPIALFRREMDRGDAFARLIMRFTQAQTDVLMQSTACNTIHSVEQRLARWLLTARDRVGRDEFPLTQEFVAMMLGVTRPTVTLVAGALQRAGLIRYRRGQLAILDRAGLERASCECYAAMNRVMRNVVDGSPPA